jgi:hypothetical protein
MADKKIKVQVDVETDVEPSLRQLRELKKQLKDTAVGSQDFINLQRQIDDVNDSLVGARAGAGNFADVLGQLPGPIGAIGGQLSGTIATLKQFSGIKISNVQASFVELGNDIVDTAKGIGNLTGITKVYTVINNALARSFTAIGIAEGTAAAGATAFAAALTATGVGAIVVAIGVAVTALIELGKELYATATGERELQRAIDKTNASIEAQARLFDLNAKSAENRRKVTIAQMKAQGKTEEEIRKFNIDQSYKDYEAAFAAEREAVKIYNDSLGKVDADALKKAQDNLDKRQQATKDAYASYLETGYNAKAEELKSEQAKNKELADKNRAASDKKKDQKQREIDEQKKLRESELAEIVKGEEDAFKATLTEREKTEYEINQKYSSLVASAIKYNQDTTLLETGRQAELTTMRTKFAEDDAAKQKEIDEKKKEELLKQQADERGILLTGLQTRLEDLDAQNQLVEFDFEQDLARLAQQRDILRQQEETELQNTELTEFQKTEIRKKYADARKGITDQEIATEKAAAAAKQEINMAYLGLFQQFGNVLGQVAGKNKALAIAGVIIQQAASIGQIIASTGIANAKAVAASPLTFGMPWVAINTVSAGLSIAASVAGAVKSIQQINQAAAQAGVTGGGGGGSVSGGASIAPPRVAGAAAPQINTTGGMNPNSQIAETLSAAQRPVRAYVVSGDVSSQQALDRRTSRAATFTGG